MWIPFGDYPLLSLVPRNYFRWDSCWNFPAGASELIPFGARSDRFCYSRSPDIHSWGFLLVFPRWSLPLLFRSLGTPFFPVGGLLFFSFLGELHPFLHLRCPTSHLLPSHISSAAVSIPAVLHLLHRSCPLLSSPLTFSDIPTSCVSVAVLIAFSSIVPCTSPLLFIYLLRSDLLLALHCSVLHCLL